MRTISNCLLTIYAPFIKRVPLNLPTPENKTSLCSYLFFRLLVYWGCPWVSFRVQRSQSVAHCSLKRSSNNLVSLIMICRIFFTCTLSLHNFFLYILLHVKNWLLCGLNIKLYDAFCKQLIWVKLKQEMS